MLSRACGARGPEHRLQPRPDRVRHKASKFPALADTADLKALDPGLDDTDIVQLEELARARPNPRLRTQPAWPPEPPPPYARIRRRKAFYPAVRLPTSG